MFFICTKWNPDVKPQHWLTSWKTIWEEKRVSRRFFIRRLSGRWTSTAYWWYDRHRSAVIVMDSSRLKPLFGWLEQEMIDFRLDLGDTKIRVICLCLFFHRCAAHTGNGAVMTAWQACQSNSSWCYLMVRGSHPCAKNHPTLSDSRVLHVKEKGERLNTRLIARLRKPGVVYR